MFCPYSKTVYLLFVDAFTANGRDASERSAAVPNSLGGRPRDATATCLVHVTVIDPSPGWTVI